MKRNFIKIGTAAASVVLVAALGVGLFQNNAAAVYTSLPYIESVADSAAQTNYSFDILEIVPARGTGSIGYYAAGFEPFRDLAAGYQNTPDAAQSRTDWMNQTILGKLREQGLVGAQDSAPLTVASAADFYQEAYPWDAHEGYAQVTLAQDDLVRLQGRSMDYRGPLQGDFIVNAAYDATDPERFFVQDTDVCTYYTADGQRYAENTVSGAYDLQPDAVPAGGFWYTPSFREINDASGTAAGVAVYVNTATAADPDNGDPADGQYVYLTDFGSGTLLTHQHYYVIDELGEPAVARDALHPYHVAAAGDGASGKFKSRVGYFEADGTRSAGGNYVQNIGYFDAAPAAGTYYYYAPQFLRITDEMTAERAIAPDRGVYRQTGGVYEYVGNYGALTDTQDCYIVLRSGAPSAVQSAEAPYAAVAAAAGTDAFVPAGYFKMQDYRYIGERRGDYAMSAGSGTVTVHVNQIYNKFTVTNNNWLARYVFDRDLSAGDAAYQQETNALIAALRVRSVLPGEVTPSMISAAELVVVSGGYRPDGAAISDPSGAISFSADDLARKPLILHGDNLSYLRDIAGGLAARVSGDKLVSQRTYKVDGALATKDFARALLTGTDAATSAPYLKYGDVLLHIENVNKSRAYDTNFAAADRLPGEVTMGGCIRYILSYQIDSGSIGPLRVLELQPTATGESGLARRLADWIYGTGTVKDADLANTVSIVTMPTSEYIGKIGSAVEAYDLIYIGGNTADLNTSPQSGETVYNDDKMDGLIYTGIGDTIRMPQNFFAGLVDTDFAYNSSTFQYTPRNNYDNQYREYWYQSFTKINASAASTTTFRFSGNDITTAKWQELVDFAKAGYPIIVSEQLAGFSTDSAVGDTTFRVTVSRLPDSYTLTAEATSVPASQAVTQTALQWWKQSAAGAPVQLGTGAACALDQSALVSGDSYWCTATFTLAGGKKIEARSDTWQLLGGQLKPAPGEIAAEGTLEQAVTRSYAVSVSKQAAAATGSGKYYQRVSAPSAGNFLIVSRNSDGSGYALKNDGGTPGSAAVTVENGRIYCTDASLVWTASGSSNFKLTNDGRYLRAADRQLTIGTSNSNNTWSYGSSRLYRSNSTRVYINASGAACSSNGSNYVYFYQELEAPTVTVRGGAGGSVSPAGRVTVPYGEDLTVAVTPDAGYKVASVPDGWDNNGNGSYTLRNITQDAAVDFTFELLDPTNTETRYVLVEDGGFTDGDSYLIASGSSGSVSLMRDNGSNAAVSGKSAAVTAGDGRTGAYLSEAAAANCVWRYDADDDALYAGTSSTQCLSYSPYGGLTTAYGSSLSDFQYAGENVSGYYYVNWRTQGDFYLHFGNNTFTGSSSSWNASTLYLFKKTLLPLNAAPQDTVALTVSGSAGGTVQPAGTGHVLRGSSLTLAAQPDDGYAVVSVKINGAEHSAAREALRTKGVWLLENIGEPTSVEVTFSDSALPTYTAEVEDANTLAGGLHYAWYSAANVLLGTDSSYSGAGTPARCVVTYAPDNSQAAVTLRADGSGTGDLPVSATLQVSLKRDWDANRKLLTAIPVGTVNGASVALSEYTVANGQTAAAFVAGLQLQYLKTANAAADAATAGAWTGAPYTARAAGTATVTDYLVFRCGTAGNYAWCRIPVVMTPYFDLQNIGGAVPRVLKASMSSSAVDLTEAHLDASSNLYRALDEIRGLNVDSLLAMPKATYNAADEKEQTIRNYFRDSLQWLLANISKPTLRYAAADFPPAYDEANRDGCALQKTNGSYWLEYTFTIENPKDPSADTSYDCRLYLDANANGVFAANEQLADIVVREGTQLVSRQTMSAGGESVQRYALQAGRTYTVSRQVPRDYRGLVPWKLSVVKNFADGTEYVHTSESGYAYVREATKASIHILQILPSHDYFDGPETLNLALNTTYQKYIHEAPDFAVTIDWIYAADFNELCVGGTVGDEILTTVMDYRYKDQNTYMMREDVTFQNLSFSESDLSGRGKTTPRRFTHFGGEAGDHTLAEYLDQYDMLICGFSDNYKDLSERSANAIVEFAESKSVLVTHDTSSYMNLPFRNYQTTAGGTVDYKKSGNDDVWYTHWGYAFNTVLRSVAQLDRYGVTDDTYGHPRALGGTAGANVLADGAEHTRTALKTAVESGNYDYAYYPKESDKTLGDTQGYNNYKLINELGALRTQYLLPTKNTDSYGRIIDSYNLSAPQPNDRVTHVTQVNRGQITSYPYSVNVAMIDDDANARRAQMQVCKTHEQYFQLNMNSEDMIVWYCLSDNWFDKIPNDVRNSYYIYTVGNITYSGAGHFQSGNTESTSQIKSNVNEVKLFVNTLFGSFRSGREDPSVEFTDGQQPPTIIKNALVAFDTMNGLEAAAEDQLIGGSPYLYFRVLNPSLGTSAIYPHFQFVIYGADGKPQGEATRYAFTVYDENGARVTGSLLGGQNYYVDLTEPGLLTSLASKDTYYIKLYIALTTKPDAQPRFQEDQALDIRKIGLFPIT